MKENITISEMTSIKQAMKLLNKTGENCLLVVDENKKLLGTVTDGDLRRSILKGVNYHSTIQEIYNRNPFVLESDKFSDKEAGEIMTRNKVDLLPILDSKEKIMDYITWEQLFGKNLKKSGQVLKVPVVIMAGGRGTRMEPFTKVLPKPLVPIHEKPIIEHIIERFTELGCSDFYITVNYKGKILKAYFEDLNLDYKVHFLDENEPLGTAGSLRLLDGQFNQPFFVTNCDIIIKADYNSLYEFHRKGGYDITLVASAKEYVIPYGTCELNGDGHLSHINEKPHYDFLINTGLYVLNPEVLKLIPENKFYHITHLIEDVKNQGKKVGVFPIDDDAWIDVGQWTEYQQAVKLL
jgi:dTDP-glucose pyrophosphorylase